MKIVIDERPSSNNNPKPFFAIRLYPETNEEMGKMEWGLSVMSDPYRVDRICNGKGDTTFHYAILFKEIIWK